jgi:RNA polymerase sigma-70 factor (ECF subfamily)
MPSGDDQRLLAALRRGDETAFAELVDSHSSALLRVARIYVGSQSVAEEVVQETWLGVLRGLDRFEGRSSLKTWIFKILANIATTRAIRERRTLPFSALAETEPDGTVPSVEPDRFLGADHDRWPHHWALGPTRWANPEESLLTGEARHRLLDAVRVLPPAQRTVITLRDIEGWPAHEVCDALGVSEGNQRVLLHRARSKVRSALEAYFGAVELTVA